MHQWLEEIQDKLGVPAERIGIAQQNRCEWAGKWFTVGLLHSVANREYDPGFYSAYGFVIFDEVHKIGTNFFAPAVSRFRARYRLGLSATVDREDGGSKVFYFHLGGIQVTSDAETLPMRVLGPRLRGPCNRFGAVPGRLG